MLEMHLVFSAKVATLFIVTGTKAHYQEQLLVTTFISSQNLSDHPQRDCTTLEQLQG